MEHHATLEQLKPDVSAILRRSNTLSEITAQLLNLRGCKYVIGCTRVQESDIVMHEPSGERHDLPRGEMIWARGKQGLKTVTMPTPALAACLRATFKELGIEGDVVELDTGVWLADRTLDNLADWARNQPLNPEWAHKSSSVYDDWHFSSGPLKFAMTFDKVAKAQAIAR